MDLERLRQILDTGESLSVEFKSDSKQISDSTIYEEIVAFANTEGGVLCIGVEDDGSVTGAKPRHDGTTDPIRLQSAIFNNTVPHINTRVSYLTHPNGMVFAIEVDPYPENCATAQGKCLRRIIGPDGKPASVPFYPHEQLSRRASLGLLDFSAQTLESASWTDLNPLEFERLRQTIQRLRGDGSLLELSNEELAKALRLVETQNGHLTPNVAGLLLLGHEASLERLLPTHEVRFHVLDSQSNVKVNEVLRQPLLAVLEKIDAHFRARNQEREVVVGFFRIPIPDYSPEGFREAVSNALLHRDYARLDAVYVQWLPDHLLITSPGGFPEGITKENLLVHEPKPRNPRLAEAFRRIGLVEQTGRGVDKIYMGQLRYGRPVPDYGRSDQTGVRVVVPNGPTSLPFAAFVYEQDRQGAPLNLEEMLILNHLGLHGSISREEAAKLMERSSSEVQSLLDALSQRGFLTTGGTQQKELFLLTPSLREQFGRERKAGETGREQQEQQVVEALSTRAQVTRSEVAALLGITSRQAKTLLERLIKNGKIRLQGGRTKGAYYVAAEQHAKRSRAK